MRLEDVIAHVACIAGIRHGPQAAAGDFRMVRQRQAPDIHRNVAGPTSTEADLRSLWLLMLAPFVRLTVPPFSTTSPPRPPVSLEVLVTIEPLSRVNSISRDGHLAGVFERMID